MFSFFPKMAKFIGYELANRIRHILRQLDPVGWTRYVGEVGFIRGQPGVDKEIERTAYLSGAERPSMFYPPQGGRLWEPMRQIGALIIPIGTPRNRDRAVAANLPIYDQAIFVPRDDPGNDMYLETETAHRLRLIIAFLQSYMLSAIARNQRVAASVVSAMSSILLVIVDRGPRLGNGLGRGLHRLFNGMVDFASNVIHSYDGTLATDVPLPLGMFDDSGRRAGSLPIHSLTSGYLVDTRVVWTLLFHTGFVFDSPQFLTGLDSSVGFMVNAEFPGPIETLNRHMGVFSY